MSAIPHGTGHDRLATIRQKMRPVASLQYGQSPWDTLDKDDLLFLIQSYHAVVQSALSALEINTFPGHRSGICEEAIVSCRAAIDHAYSDFIGPAREKVESGIKQVDGNLHGWEESEVLWRATMRPVNGLLAFDVPYSIWWACNACETCLGINPGATPTAPRMKDCDGGSKCSFRRATWEDWRAYGRAALATPATGEG